MARLILRYAVIVGLDAIALLSISTALNLPHVQASSQAEIIVCAGSIQACLDAASDGDTVVIPAATYTESLTVSKAVSVTGVDSALTIIHAVEGQRVLTVTGMPLSSSLIISGLTLTGGSADDGGGLLADRDVTLINLRFISNTAQYRGGGLAAESVIIFDTQFIGNRTMQSVPGGGGGGLYALKADITRGHFADNAVTGVDLPNEAFGMGGGINAYTLTLTATQFISNAAFFGGGASADVVQATGSRFERNAATYGGGGLFAVALDLKDTDFIANWSDGGGGLWLPQANSVEPSRIVGGRFEGNTAAAGAGLASNANGLVLSGTQFIRNIAAHVGGGLHVSGDQVRIVNALLVSNTAGIEGAAVAVGTGNVVVLHTTIAGPDTNFAAALFNWQGTLQVVNTIVAQHATGIKSKSATTADYNLFFGNLTNTLGTLTGSHSLIGDPRFVDPLQDDYHLRFGSATIDQGTPLGITSDLDGASRPIGLGFDIGAYEYQGAVYRSFVPLLIK